MADAQTLVKSSARPYSTTVLVVEDEVLVRALISETLRDQGYTVIEAINADEAVSILHSHIQLDLVLTDMRMPGTMDGAALVRLIRAEFPFMNVVMVSGQSPDAALRELLDGYIPKPVTPSQLCTYLETAKPSAGARNACT